MAQKILRLKHGISFHDSFRQVFSLIDWETLQKATVGFLVENVAQLRHCLGAEDDGYRLVCVDGKEERGTGKKYGTAEVARNFQTLHVYDATNSICRCSHP